MNEMEAFLRRSEEKDAKQGSAAWLYERVGFITASRFGAVIARTKAGKPTAERDKYLWDLVVERLTGQPQDHFTSSAMQWGTEQEANSRMAYEAATGRMVEEVGFIKHPTLARVGGSPDGLIGDDGGWESKSPWNSAVHLLTWLQGMPEDHIPQVQGLMWITGRDWWDFQSFDPRLPERLQRYIQRVPRDDKFIAAMEAEIITLEAEVSATVAKIIERCGGALTPPDASRPPPAGSAPAATDEEIAERMEP